MPSLAATKIADHDTVAFSVSTPRKGWSRDWIEVQEEERRRISHELHDDLGQRLALIEIRLDQLGHGSLPPEVVTGLKNVKFMIGEMDRDIHRICYELYPVVLEKLGLIAGLRSLCSDFSEASGVTTTFEHRDIPEYVAKNASLCLYRVAQEALHNITKHSRAQSAQVSLIGTAEGLEITIVDSGVGFDPFLSRTRRGLGLVTIAERVQSVGGSCSIHSSPGLGTEVRAMIYAVTD